MTNLVAPSHPDSDVCLTEVIDRLVASVNVVERFERELLERARNVQMANPAAGAVGQGGELVSLEDLPGGCRQKKWLSRGERSALVKSYLAGDTTYDLAERYGIHRTTVARIIRKNGHKVGRTGLLPRELPEAIRLYEDGNSLASLGNRFETSPEHVRLQLIEAGVSMRPRGGRRT